MFSTVLCLFLLLSSSRQQSSPIYWNAFDISLPGLLFSSLPFALIAMFLLTQCLLERQLHRVSEEDGYILKRHAFSLQTLSA